MYIIMYILHSGPGFCKAWGPFGLLSVRAGGRSLQPGRHRHGAVGTNVSLRDTGWRILTALQTTHNEQWEFLMNCLKVLLVVAIAVALCAVSGPVWAQKSYDDHELTDRFYIRIGGFRQSDIRTSLSLGAKTPQGGAAAGAIVVIESLFDVDTEVSTVRLDGWYRFGKKNRINWTYWRTDRDGTNTYSGETIEIGDFVITDGEQIKIDDRTTLFAVSYTYSFLNTEKYEAWIGAGLNLQSLDKSLQSNVGGNLFEQQEKVKGTVPIPVFQFGGRWNFGKRWRMLLTQELFGIKIGDYSGKLNNTRILAEFNITKRFGIGAGLERYIFQVNADTDNFTGTLDRSYSGLTLYLKGQI